MKNPRNTPIRNQTSIVQGVLYFEDVRQCAINTDEFVEILEDKYTTSLRLVSLASSYYEHQYLMGVGYVDFDLKVEMTLRKEMRSGCAYWYAYRDAGGKKQKRYVGKSEAVTSERIVKIAQRML